MSARAEVFRGAMRDRAFAVTLARTMVATAVSAPQFLPGLGAILRAHPPDESIGALADLFAKHGQAEDADGLRKLANVVAFHGLTWRQIDGN